MAHNAAFIDAALALGIDPMLVPERDAPSRSVSDVVTSRVPDPQADLTEKEALEVAKVLPPEPRIACAISNIQVVNALIWIERTGRPLTHLPERFGSYEAVRKRAERWAVAGVWDVFSNKLNGLEVASERRFELGSIASKQIARGKRIRRSRNPDY